MPRARDPNRDKAFEIWKMYNCKISNRAFAEQLGVPEKTRLGIKWKHWSSDSGG
ncbi:phage terminase small subunit-related protein [Fictibacillus solisalsi]|uniref:phage terminase small subunit-related protein n=1 Tax=Fictibacillus solisalsi TaxID=459525 RepID=UPI000B7D7A33